MNYTRYAQWKGWNRENFGICGPGSRFSFGLEFNGVLKGASDVLEIGYGNGELLAYFHSQGHRVVGLEINESLVEIARAKGFTAYLGKPWEVPELCSRKFGLIVGLAVAEHMGHSDLVEFFRWAECRLCDTGVLFLKFPEGSSPFALGYQNGDFTHLSCLTKTKIEALCEMSNMSLISYSDERLLSNKLCSFGLFGRLLLTCMQMYAKSLKFVIRAILFPLCPNLSLATNSIAIIKPLKAGKS